MSTAVTLKCKKCRRKFTVRRYRAKKAKFCSVKCRRNGRVYRCAGCGKRCYRSPSHVRGRKVFHSVACAAKHTRFQKGLTPWNKDLRGIHLSPQSEFKKGRVSTDRVPVGTISIRCRHKRGGEKRAFIKVAEPNVWRLRAHVVWETHHGPIPKGRLVHHKDRDKLNDAVSNLELQTRAEHLNEHRPEFKPRSCRKRLAALPSAS